MRKILISFFLFFFFNLLYSQEIHSINEIIKILENSEITYKLDEATQRIYSPNRDNILNINNSYRVKTDSGSKTILYKESLEVEELMEEAEDYFKNDKMTEARMAYLKVLDSDPNYFKAMTYIGQTYGIQKELDKAEEWYKKSISNNFIDYMAHWFLADIYRMKGNLDYAVREITIAKILNRNNPRIQKSLDNIYKLKKLNYSNWVFNPQCKVDSIDEKSVVIKSDPNWMGYAIVEAVWMYEPGYKESMGFTTGRISLLRIKEGLFALYVGIDKKNVKKYPEFQALKMIIENKQMDEFVFYENILPDYPGVAFQLTEDFIGKIADYIIKTRSKVKIKNN